MGERVSMPFLLKINNEHLYSINLNTSYSIVEDEEEMFLEGEEAYLNFCRSIGLPTF